MAAGLAVDDEERRFSEINENGEEVDVGVEEATKDCGEAVVDPVSLDEDDDDGLPPPVTLLVNVNVRVVLCRCGCGGAYREEAAPAEGDHACYEGDGRNLVVALDSLKDTF